jgi:hypothetical protein
MTEVTLQYVVNIYLQNMNELSMEDKKINCYKTWCQMLSHFTFSVQLHSILTVRLLHAVEHKRLIKIVVLLHL